MKRAIELAKQSNGEIPVGAFIIKDDEIISSASNQKEKLNDVTAICRNSCYKAGSRKTW